MRLKAILSKASLVAMTLLMISAGGITKVEAQSTKTTEATINFVAGPLVLNTVSEDLDFGKGLIIQAAEETYEDQGTATAFNVNLTDDRGFSNELAWKLTAGLSQFGPEAEPTLKGASIIFDAGTPINSDGFTAPTASGFELISGAAAGTIASAQRTIDDDTIGIGIWDINYDMPTLKVKENSATPGTHNATITWTLSVGP